VPTTIADVAARAGVSTATVSRVLAGIGRARPETRERVIAAARELEYRPSAIARSLRIRSTRTIGVITTDITNPFYAAIVRVIDDAVCRRKQAILLGNSGEVPEREADYLDLLTERRVDGIIIASSALSRRHADWLRKAEIPVVLINTDAGGGILPSILSDNWAGSRAAVEYLVAIGHREIGIVAGSIDNVATAQRVQGAIDGLAAAGLADHRVVHGDGHIASGAMALDELLDRWPETTAIVCHNDLMALGAVGRARSRGLRVPTDISIVGFDDIDLARFLDPPLTTLAQDVAAMGEWAVQRLAAELAAREAGHAPWSSGSRDVVHLPVNLQIRGSTGRAPVTAPRGASS
jgi:LacI family transcriptional regulator